MSNVLRRLQKLEARLTDGSGFAPHSEAWLEYWKEKLDRFLTKRDASALHGMPIGALDDIIEKSKHKEQSR
jgi:hypothetical protein